MIKLKKWPTNHNSKKEMKKRKKIFLIMKKKKKRENMKLSLGHLVDNKEIVKVLMRV